MAVDLKVRDLELVVLLSETLNVHAVADTLGMSQPGVTKRLQELERHVRAKLFERDNAKVAITAHGRHFVKHARVSIESCRRAVTEARVCIDEEEAILHVGKSPFVDQDLVSVLNAVSLPLYPSLRVDSEADFSCDLVRSLLQKSIDVALVNSPQRIGKINFVSLRKAPFQIGFRDDHPLMDRSGLTFADIAEYPWMLFSRRAHPLLYDQVLRRAEDLGISYRMAHSFLHPEEALPHLSSSEAVVWLTPNAAGSIAYRGIHTRPLLDEQVFLETFIACRADDRSALVNEFVRAFVRKVNQLSTLRPLRGAVARRDGQLTLFTQ
jgi:DNA-binding transcriptional LysR family regulator